MCAISKIAVFGDPLEFLHTINKYYLFYMHNISFPFYKIYITFNIVYDRAYVLFMACIHLVKKGSHST